MLQWLKDTIPEAIMIQGSLVTSKHVCLYFQQLPMHFQHSLEFLQEQLPDLDERIRTARFSYEGSITSTGCVPLNDLTKEKLCDALAVAHKDLFGACNLLVEAVEAVKLLRFAVENTDLEYKLKANMLDEAMRFQMKHWQLTETEHESH